MYLEFFFKSFLSYALKRVVNHPCGPLRKYPWQSSPPQEAQGKEGWHFTTARGDSAGKMHDRTGSVLVHSCVLQLLVPHNSLPVTAKCSL